MLWLKLSIYCTVVGPVFINMCIHPWRAQLSWRDWRFWLSAYTLLKKWWTIRSLLWLSNNTPLPLCQINLSWRKKNDWGLSSSETMGIQVALGVPQAKLLHCILYGLMALLSFLVGSYCTQQKITLPWYQVYISSIKYTQSIWLEKNCIVTTHNE